MKKLIITALILLFAGCATSPDPRMLAAMPTTAIPPVAPLIDGIYTMPGTGVTQLVLMFPGGTILDPAGKEGAADLLCSSMVSGGAKDITPDEMDAELDRLAVDVSISPQREYTLVSMSFLPDVEDRAVYLLNTIVKSPLLESSRVELNRSLMKEDIIRKDEEAVEQAFILFRKHFYRGDPRQASPTAKSVGAISYDDMQKIHKQVFSQKPVIGIIGSLSEKNVNIIKASFTGSFNPSRLGPAPSPEYGLYSGNAVQKHCVLAMIAKAPDMSDKAYAASVAADLIIGSGGFNSMLVKEVRTKQGLAYSANSFYQAKPLWGIFGIIVITEPKDITQVRSAIAAVFEAAGKGITQSDIDWAKASITNRTATEYNTPSGIISHSMDYLFYNIPTTFDKKFLADIKGLSLDDVQKAADAMTKGPWVEVIINAQE